MSLSKTDKPDKLDMLITLAVQDYECDELNAFLNADTSDVTFSESYYRRRNAFIRKYRRKPQVAMLKKFASAAAVVMLTVMSAAFLTIMSISALRDAVFKVIVEWYDDYISIRFDQPLEESDAETTEGTEQDQETVSKETSGVETVAVVAPTEILEYKKPIYLPEGVKEVIISKRSTSLVVEYYMGDQVVGTFWQRLYNEQEMLFDNEAAELQVLEINGTVAAFLQSDSNEEISIIWSDGQYVYTFRSYLNSEETIRIAQSIG